MSSLLESMEVETTESLGFKFLFSKPLLQGVGETIPFSKLSNISLHPIEKLLCLASAKTASVYNLQSIRDGSFDLVNTKEFPSNVVGVFFVAETLCAVLEDGVIWITELPDYAWKQHSSTDSVTVSCTIYNGKLFVLGENKRLNQVDLSTNGVTEQLNSIDECVDLASTQDKLYILHKNGNITVLNKSLDTLMTIEKPALDDPSEPISISVLSSSHLLVSYGEPVDTVEEEDIMYDITAYIVDLNTKQFTPSIDIAPPYSTVKRNPSYYTETLFKITEQLPYLFVVGSACASEISIASPSQVFKPDQDAACAILPINPNSDNDTQPVGIALDLFSKGTVFEPCSGVDSADNLPLLYVLTNLGELYCWALYHHTALQDSSFSLDQTKSHYLKSFKDLSGTGRTPLSSKIEPISRTENAVDEPSKSEDIETKNPLGGSSILGTTEAFSKGFSFGTPASTPSPFERSESQNSNNSTIANSSAAFGKPAFGQTAFGAPNFDTAGNSESGSAFGKPAFSSSAFGNTIKDKDSATSAGFGVPKFGEGVGTTTSSSAFGKPAFGSSSFGGTSTSNTGSPFGKPAFGANSATNTTESPFGKPAFGANTTTSTTESPFGKPMFGANSATNTTESPFGKPAFGANTTTSTTESPFGKPMFGANSATSTTESPFGKPMFGANSATNTTESPFGKPAFGANTTTSTTESPFGKSAFGANSATNTTESPFGKPAFGSSAFGATNATTSSGSLFGTNQDAKSPQKTPIPDPFGHLKSETKSSSAFSFSDVADAISGTSETLEESAKISNLSESESEHATDSSIDEEDSLVSETSQVENDSAAEITSTNSSIRNLGSTIDAGSDVAKDTDTKIATPVESDAVLEPMEEAEAESIEEAETDSKEEKTSVASLTDRIKRAANVSTDEIPIALPQNIVTENKDKSPFSAFSNFQNKEQSPAPTFSFGKPSDSQQPKDTAFSFSQKSAESNKLNDGATPVIENPCTVDNESKKTESSVSSKVNVSLSPTKTTYESKEMQTEVVLKNNSTQTDFNEKIDTSQQSFENDEHHLASIYEPQSLPNFFNAAKLKDFKPLSSDQVVQAIERTHAEVLGNVQVLKDNINNIEDFVNDQIKHPFKRTEATVNNVSSWRIDETKDLLEILRSKSKDISKLQKSSKLLEENCSEDPDLDILLNNLKRQFEALNICNEHYNNPNRKLSWSQHHISAVVKKKLETVSLRLDKIKEAIRVLKLYNISDNKETINIIKQLTANSGSGRTNLLREIKALREEVSNLKISMEKKQSLNSKKVLLAETVSPVPLLETTLELNIRSQLGDFFSSRVGC